MHIHLFYLKIFCRKKDILSDTILKKLNKFVELKAQHDALILEQYVVTDQVIASAKTAQLESIALALVR